MKQRLKINGLLMSLAACLVIIFPGFFLRFNSSNPINNICELFGFALVLFGLLLRVSARGYKSESSKEGYALVSGAPYKFTRNPMYLGIMLIGVGLVLALFKYWVNAVFILIFIARYISLIFTEEKRLVKQFGQSYRDYLQSAPRIFFRVNTLITKDIREVLPLKLSWVNKEIGSVIGFILGLLLIVSGKDIYISGFRVYLKELAGFLLLLGLFFILALYLSRNGKKEKS